MISRENIQRMIVCLAPQRADARCTMQRTSKGFTLVETMLALLIVVLLTGIVATGIPVAYNAYAGVVNRSNAQLALSTTASVLRDELGLAVKMDRSNNNTAFYQTSDGSWATIVNSNIADTKKYGLVKRKYKTTGSSFDPNNPGDFEDINLTPGLVKGQGAGDADLRVRMVAATDGGPLLTCEGDVFKMHRIEVLLEGVPTDEHIDDYQVKCWFKTEANT